MRLGPLLLVALLASGAAWGQARPVQAGPAAASTAPIAARTGEHPGFGRLVFDFTAAPAYRIEQRGDLHMLSLPPGTVLALDTIRRLPRNFAGMRAVAGGVEITLMPGARLRVFRNGPKLAIDALDPPVAAQAALARTPAPPAPAVPAPSPAQASTARPVPPPAAPAPASPATSIPTPARAASIPTPAPAAPPAAEREAPPPPTPVPAPAASSRVAVSDLPLPFPPDAGAAMLRRGDAWLIILDTPPEAPLSETPRPGMRYQPIPGGALLTLEDAPAAMRLRRQAGRWFLTESQAEGEPIAAVNEGAGVLALPAPGAQGVLSIQDPVTGMPVLLGTMRGPQEHGARIAVTRAMVDMQLLETALGVAVLARSDAVVMRASADRFTLGADGGGRLSLGGPTTAERARQVGEALAPGGPTRSFEFPNGTPSELAARLRAQRTGLAQAAPLARGMQRLAAAETLLSLGQPQEAQAMIRLAQAEDPIIAALPRAAWLAGAAALAAGRPDEAAPLEAEPISDETAMWRGMLQALRGEAAEGASVILRGRGILRGYPEALQRRLLPHLAEALGAARQTEVAAALLEGGPTVPGLELARAVLGEQGGDARAALAAYDAIINGRDRRMRAEAMRRAAELRLASGEIDALAASRALEQTLFAWRDEGAEFNARQRIAALRQRGGDPAGALALLREAAALFPDREAVLQPAITAAFLAALEVDTPLNAVALHDAHPQLLPNGPAGAEALAMLAERLMALDLSDRAVALLRQAMDRAPPGPARAAVGTRLAALHLGERDGARALAALADSAGPGLSEALAQQRAMLAARAQAQQGQGETSAFTALGAAGDEALAEFLAERRDFAGAAAALARHLDRALAGQAAPLEPALARGLVRQAALLALAGDMAGLAELRSTRGPLLAGGPGEAPFQLLTTDPVRGLADLPRLHGELELFRVLPARLDRLRSELRTAR